MTVFFLVPICVLIFSTALKVMAGLLKNVCKECLLNTQHKFLIISNVWNSIKLVYNILMPVSDFVRIGNWVY
jgi:hypothetical protein